MASAALPRASAAPIPLADEPRLHTRNQPLLLVGIMAASLIQILDSTIANVAIPHMQSSLSATADSVTWVLTSYIIASAVAMPITGWLADRIGARTLFIAAVAGFIVTSMLCGMAQNLEQMVAFRAMQGIAGAFIPPLSQSFMLDTNRPSRHPQVMAIWGIGIMLGPILGPILGGWLTESASWRWVFYVNLPIGMVSLAILLAELPHRDGATRRFDMVGFALVGLALAALQLMLDRGNHVDWFHAAEIWLYAFVALSAGWIMVIHLSTAREPLFPRSLFADRNFTIGLILMSVVGVVLFANMALMPPMLQRLFGFDVIDTGLVLMPRGIGVLISMQISGQLLRRGMEPRLIVGLGFLITAYSQWQMAQWSLAADTWQFASDGLLQGLGLGLIFIPVNSTSFATLPPQLRTDGSSLLNLARSLGASVGISLTTILLAANIQRGHEEIGSRLNPAGLATIDLATIDRYQSAADMALQMMDNEVNRQAAMVAYVDDFWLMMWLALAAVPLVLLMRPVGAPARPVSPPPDH